MPVTHQQPNADYSPWPHRWAVVLSCATFPLIWVGGLVTTTDAGMAVPDWPTTYGYNLFLYPLSEWFFGPWDLFIEHGHRLLGAVVGLLTIGLLWVLWRTESRRWVQVFGLALLVGVIMQGVLGGMRVRLDERALAMLHGCTGPLFFAACVAMAVVTSRRWREEPRAERTERRSMTSRLLPVAIATALVAYLQLVAGAQLRHVPVTAEASVFRAAVHLHLSLAAVLLLHVLWLAVASLRSRRGRWVTAPPLWLVGLILLQLCLGAATWLVKYGPPLWVRELLGEWDYAVPAASRLQSVIVTGHVAAGSLIVAMATLAALRLGRIGYCPRSTYVTQSSSVEAAV